MNLLAVHTLNWVSIVAAAIIAFGLGMLFKSAMVMKQRKRILRLENEMLANHANILELEKRLAEVKKEKTGGQPSYEMPLKSDRGLKAS